MADRPETAGVLYMTGIPANGRPCGGCYGTGCVLFAGRYWLGPSGMQMHEAGATAGPFYMNRCRDTGGGMWPKPDHREECQHCDGTGVMGPRGEALKILGPRTDRER